MSFSMMYHAPWLVAVGITFSVASGWLGGLYRSLWFAGAVAFTLASGTTALMPFQSEYAPEIQMALDRAALGSTVSFIACVVAGVGIAGRKAVLFYQLMRHAGLALLGLILISAPFTDVSVWVPFFVNPSMTGCLLAVLSPFFWHADGSRASWVPIILTALTAIALGLLGASMPVLVFVVAQVLSIIPSVRAYVWAEDPRTRRGRIALSAAVVLASVACVAAFANASGDLASGGNGRFQIWALAAQNLLDHPAHLIFGHGLGSWSVLFPMIQIDAGANPDNGVWWLWAHNDWLQLVFERGIIGLVLWAGLAVTVLVRTWGRAPLHFAALVGWLLCAFGNMPAHFAFHAMVGAALGLMALRLPKRGIF